MPELILMYEGYESKKSPFPNKYICLESNVFLYETYISILQILHNHSHFIPNILFSMQFINGIDVLFLFPYYRYIKKEE